MIWCCDYTLSYHSYNPKGSSSCAIQCWPYSINNALRISPIIQTVSCRRLPDVANTAHHSCMLSLLWLGPLSTGATNRGAKAAEVPRVTIKLGVRLRIGLRLATWLPGRRSRLGSPPSCAGPSSSSSTCTQPLVDVCNDHYLYSQAPPCERMCGPDRPARRQP
jgi:hypothetical protein